MPVRATDPDKTNLRHIIIKFSNVKDKERILKASRQKKQITYKRASICLAFWQWISQQKPYRPVESKTT